MEVGKSQSLTVVNIMIDHYSWQDSDHSVAMVTATVFTSAVTTLTTFTMFTTVRSFTALGAGTTLTHLNKSKPKLGEECGVWFLKAARKFVLCYTLIFESC